MYETLFHFLEMLLLELDLRIYSLHTSQFQDADLLLQLELGIEIVIKSEVICEIEPVIGAAQFLVLV